jgi:hypothetical protein
MIGWLEITGARAAGGGAENAGAGTERLGAAGEPPNAGPEGSDRGWEGAKLERLSKAGEFANFGGAVN